MLLRQEIRDYVRISEQLLSDQLEPQLTEDEQDVLIYYVNEFIDKFGHAPSLHAPGGPGTITKPRVERRRKMCTKQLQLEHGLLKAVVTGEFELTAAEIEFCGLLDEAVRSGATKVLVDGQELTGNLGDFERFLYGEFAARATMKVMRERNIKLRFAYVIHEPLRDPQRFGENVAVNRGMDVKVFEDVTAAIKWLNRG